MQYSVAPAHACARLTAQAAIPFPMQICAIRRGVRWGGRAAAVAEGRSGVSQWLRALTWRAGGGGGKRDGRARGSGKNFEADIELQLTAIQPSACLTRPRSRHRKVFTFLRQFLSIPRLDVDPSSYGRRHARGPSKSGVHDLADFHNPSRGQARRGRGSSACGRFYCREPR